MTKVRNFLFFIAFLSIVGWGPFTALSNFFSPKTAEVPAEAKEWVDNEMSYINSQADNIDQNVLKLGLVAYLKAKNRGIVANPYLTIIDYSKPSTERRLWVVDMRSNKVLFNTWVTHGKNSGDVMATSFSNEPGSLKSSIGVFLTKDPYTGGNGYSLRLVGLEQGINDNALRRSIVVHGAWYADPNVIKTYGQIGRSWGCPAVSPGMIRPLINAIKDNSLVVVYYPDRNWLTHSSFLATG
jgi:hypothetical protein